MKANSNTGNPHRDRVSIDSIQKVYYDALLSDDNTGYGFGVTEDNELVQVEISTGSTDLQMNENEYKTAMMDFINDNDVDDPHKQNLNLGEWGQMDYRLSYVGQDVNITVETDLWGDDDEYLVFANGVYANDKGRFTAGVKSECKVSAPNADTAICKVLDDELGAF